MGDLSRRRRFLPVIPALYPVIPALYPVIPALYPVIPAKAGIQRRRIPVRPPAC